MMRERFGRGIEDAHGDLMNRATDDHASLTSTDNNGLGWRLAYVGFLGAVASGVGLTFVGLCRGETGCFGLAAVAGVFALGFRGLLHRLPVPVDEERDVASEMEAAGKVALSGAAVRVEELVRVLQAWSDMERARGTPEFDPWAWQSLRTEVRTLLREDPELLRLLGVGV